MFKNRILLQLQKGIEPIDKWVRWWKCTIFSKDLMIYFLNLCLILGYRTRELMEFIVTDSEECSNDKTSVVRENFINFS
jgi:hypothetical protein